MLAFCCFNTGVEGNGANTKEEVVEVVEACTLPVNTSQVVEPPCEEEEEDEEDSHSFKLSAERGDGFGMKLEMWPGFIQVVSIHRGTIERYNATAAEGKRVVEHDFITMVNGATEVREMVRKLKQGRVLLMTVVHPERKHVKFEVSAGSLGIKLHYLYGDSTCLQVVDFAKDGAADLYNTRAAPEARVCLYDFVESVNGIRGSAEVMLKEIQTAGSVEMVLLRPSAMPRSNKASIRY